jgi:hypothetical protein
MSSKVDSIAQQNGIQRLKEEQQAVSAAKPHSTAS